MLKSIAVISLGYGSSLTSNGVVEMDAMCMDGTKMRAGAVAGITNVANPITLAKRVMEQVRSISIRLSIYY